MSTKKFENILPVEILDEVRAFMARRIVGQNALIESMLLCFVAGGHILIEGLPGLAKTLTAKTFAQIFDLSFKRIQFSPDLLPSDLTGNLVFLQNTGRFSMRRGPIFTNICLLDELNRAPSKVQSALLEAMEEKQVTIGRKTHKLDEPFFVLATENPIEEEGTYQLSQAQKDRFLMKIMAEYPSRAEEVAIVEKITSSYFASSSNDSLSHSNLSSNLQEEAQNEKGSTVKFLATCKEKKPLFSREILLFLRNEASKVNVSNEITNYIVSLVSATRPSQSLQNSSIGSSKERNTLSHLSYIDVGSSPRASIALQLLAKILAMFRGRSYVLPEDVKHLALPVLQHRIKLSFEAIADGIKESDVISSILNTIPQP